MVVEFRPRGVCSQLMRVELDEDQVIRKMEVVGQPQVMLSYTVTDIRRPWLRDTVIQD